MAAGQDRFIYVSEDAIAFWGCLFPVDEKPVNVYRTVYAHHPTEIQTFAFPGPVSRYTSRSVETWFKKEYAQANWGHELQFNPSYNKIKGYQLAWYSHQMGSVEQQIDAIHSALIFSRCFFFPTKPEYASFHASRVQHLFGIRGLTKAAMKRIVHGKHGHGYSFCDVVVRMKMHGLDFLPADFLPAESVLIRFHKLSIENLERNSSSPRLLPATQRACPLLLPTTSLDRRFLSLTLNRIETPLHASSIFGKISTLPQSESI